MPNFITNKIDLMQYNQIIKIQCETVNLGLWVPERLNMHGVVCNMQLYIFCIIHLFNKHIEDLINHIRLTAEKHIELLNDANQY
jgi:hypothetical protein